MQMLKDRIVKDGQVIGTEIVKVDCFLNHQIDVDLVSEIGKEFAARFADLPINKILTIESSGIALACATAMHMGNLPVVFAKKAAPNTMTDGYYYTEVTSFTKKAVYTVIVSKKYLSEQDNILIIDDFLAYGEAAFGLIDLTKQAGAAVCGFGAAVEKAFQGGGDKLRKEGYRVESLSVIASIEDDHITFRE
ncbi:MAG TPA: xanthine phosphoribosyltransferase [Bacillota bacterium]|jgi:xanthine phosphoribosyltransferase|nr:xanthine phosphoribosyltransferase [Bacillota bacterium]HPZ58943.1 xanthine phosphoribosyltransferase [Bacillota bacterium]HQC82702.1 xanthine phosphoribosyltransferase [Bacillota bacterium]